MRIVFTKKDYQNAMHCVEIDATHDLYGNPWFKSKEEFDQWAGDVFYDLLESVFKTLDIEFEEEEEE